MCEPGAGQGGTGQVCTSRFGTVQVRTGRHAKSWKPGNLVPDIFEENLGHFTEIQSSKTMGKSFVSILTKLG